MVPFEDEEDEPILGGLDLTPPATSIPLVGLREEEQLALTMKASMDTIREEQATKVASFIYDRPASSSFFLYFLFFV